MPTYITLVNLTEQGIRNIKQVPDRIQEALQIATDLGVRFTPYMTIGPYDFVGIAEAPDDETIAQVNLSIASRGDVRTLTMPAFGIDEIGRIVEGIR
ncbi:MAG: GYD domain-containing protein [Armatimonadetes bacterium]|nr:GYD domain-containing protein [Armatimonadota bacterium]